MHKRDPETVERRPDLFARIRFNPALEDLAFRRMEEGDLAGARSALRMLLERLDLSGAPSRRAEAALLLVEVLLEVSRRAHGAPQTAPGLAERSAIVEAFAGCADPEEVRRRFPAILDRLLARISERDALEARLVERAKDLVRTGYARPVSLARIASLLGVPPGYLSRRFRRETGETLTHYIHRVRLQNALLLLAAGGRSLSEVAVLVGYRSYRDFYRNFIKHEKAAPRLVRHRLASA